MNEYLKAHYDALGQQTVKALEANRFTARYFSTVQEAKEYVLSLIPDGASVGFGGSVTVKGMDIQETIKEKGCIIYDHTQAKDPQERHELSLKELTCDVFLTSSNAITRDGKLYNVDGAGNRVAAMIFGPKQVIVVAGINKVVNDLAEAEERVRLICGPANSIRVGAPNPCTKTGYCIDCDSERRICNAAVVLHKQPSRSSITVVIVGEELGF